MTKPGIHFKVDISPFARHLDKILADLLTGRGPGIVFRAGQTFRNHVMEVIKDGGKVGSTGDLRKRIHVEQGQRAGVVTAVVKPGVHYAVFVHEGTKPHWPPLAPLETWVRRKLKKKGEEAEEIARGIQRHIGWHGTEAFPFFRIAEDKYGSDIKRQIAKEVRDVIQS